MRVYNFLFVLISDGSVDRRPLLVQVYRRNKISQVLSRCSFDKSTSENCKLAVGRYCDTTIEDLSKQLFQPLWMVLED